MRIPFTNHFSELSRYRAATVYPNARTRIPPSHAGHRGGEIVMFRMADVDFRRPESRWRIDRAHLSIDGGRMSSSSASNRSRAYSLRFSLIASGRSPRSASSSRTSPDRVRWSNVGNTGHRPLVGPLAGGSSAAEKSPDQGDSRRPTAVSSGKRPYSRRREISSHRTPRRRGSFGSGAVPRHGQLCTRGRTPKPGHEPPSAPHSALAACRGDQYPPEVSCTLRRHREPVRRRGG